MRAVAHKHGEMGEQELIARIARAARRAGADRGGGVVLGIGDDAAILRPRAGEDLVFTVDDQVEDVHFRRAWPLEAVGEKAAGAAVSDLAAMGARPLGALFALEPPPDWDDRALGRVAEGLVRALARSGCPLAGGNVAARRRGSGLSLSISVVGTVERGRALRRDAGRPGDVLLVSGAPGLARAGLLALERGVAAPAAVRKLLRPEPRLALGRALVLSRVRVATIDLSDGLGGDAGKLAAASGCRAVIEAARLPAGRALASAARALRVPARDLVLEGGEDYELLVAVRPCDARRLPRGLARVGRLERGKGAVVELEDGSVRALGVGFDHRA